MASVPRQLGSQTGAILELAEYGLGGCLLPVRVVSAKKDSHPVLQFSSSKMKEVL